MSSSTPDQSESFLWSRLLRNSGWLLGARAINAPLALLETAILARLLGVEGYGTLAIVMGGVTIAQKLVSFRMNEVTVKFVTDELEKDNPTGAAATLKFALQAEAVFATGAFILVNLLAGPIARYFAHDPSAAGLVKLYSLALLAAGALETMTGALQVFNRFELLAGINVLRKIILILLLGVAWSWRADLRSVLLAYILSGLLASLVMALQVHRLAAARLGTGWWRTPIASIRKRIGPILSFAWRTNLGATLSLIIRDSDVLWLGFFRPTAEVGLFKLATSLLKAPFAAGSPIAKSFYPEITRLVHRVSSSEIRRLLVKATRFSAYWVLPVSLVTAWAAPFVIRVLHGEEFLPAVPALRIMLIGYALANVLFWTRPTLLALDRAGATLGLAVVNALLKVPLALLVIPFWGYLGLSAILSFLYVNGLLLAVIVVRATLNRNQRANPA